MRKSLVSLAAMFVAGTLAPAQSAVPLFGTMPPPARDLSRSLVGQHMKRDGSGLVGLTVEQLNAKGNGQRAMSVASFDVAARTVELAFSSEYEQGERWFGIEVLDHGQESVDLDRLRDGGALLVNHGWDDQVGVVVSASIDADRVGRAVVRFGNSPRAQEIFQDVVDGIRKHVSVGYRILDAVLAERRGDVDVYRVTRWQPYEISLVPVPFDPTVGVGRSMENNPVESKPAPLQNPTNQPATRTESISTMEKTLRDKQGNLVRALVDDAGNITQVLAVLEKAGESEALAATRGASAERTRSASILQMGQEYGLGDMARQFVQDGKTVEDFTRAALADLNTRGQRPLSDKTTPAPKSAQIGLSDREVRGYSLFRAARALANPGDRTAQEDAAFEIECSQTAQRELGRESRGILIPDDVLVRAFNAGGAANTPAGATSGANLVETEFRADSFIGMLRNRTTIMRLARTMAGLVGDVEMPKQTGGATAGWIGEHAEAPEGTPVIGQLALAPKTVSAYTDLSRKLMKQSTPDAENIVRQDLAAAVAIAIDSAGFYGTGTGNAPRGIKNYAGINGVPLAGVHPTYAEFVEMESQIAADNADVQSMAYVLNAIGRGQAKTTQKFTGTNGAPIWEPGNTINGYRTEVTNQIEAGDYFFGNFQDMLVGMWGGLDMIVDPYSLSKQGGLRIVVFQDVDFVLRRTESFVYAKKTA